MARAQNVVLIHADGALGRNSTAVEPLLGDGTRARLRTLAAYCDWLSRYVGSVYLLVPDSVRAQLQTTGERFGKAELLGYGHDRRVRCPNVSAHARVWLINGERMPMVDWTMAADSAPRSHGQVVLFGTATAPPSDYYVESVLVGDEDEVLGFTRNYDDSTYFADLSSAPPAFAVTTGACAKGVVTHVLSRGWGLDSVGAMTRRFSVSWAERPCQLDDGHDLEQGPRRTLDPMLLESGSPPFTAASAGFVWCAPHAPEADPPENAVRATNAAVNMESSGKGVRNRARTWVFRFLSRKAAEKLRLRASATSRTPAAGGSFYPFAKRALDVSASLVGLFVLSPVLVGIALLIKLTSRGPVLFAHRRQGLRGREFNCLKFRSMRQGADALQAQLRAQNEVDGPQFKMAADPRLTPLGRFLRESNLDELPQLINVLLGHMSLVGPRPSPDNENQLCPAWRRTRLSVKPGITGLWQVMRCRQFPDSDFQQWIAYDVAYAKHRSLWLDLQILIYTPLSMRSSRHVRGFAERLERRGVCSPVAKLQDGNTFYG